MDFGIRSLGPSGAQGSDEGAEWSNVEVVGEVTNQARLDNEKILQFCDYARSAFYNLVDRVLLYGFLIHKEDYHVELCIHIRLQNHGSVNRTKQCAPYYSSRCGTLLRGQCGNLRFRGSWSSICNEIYGRGKIKIRVQPAKKRTPLWAPWTVASRFNSLSDVSSFLCWISGNFTLYLRISYREASSLA